MNAKAILIALICGVIWVGFWGIQHISGKGSFLDQIESVLVDFRVHVYGPGDSPSDIAIVAIDDATIAAAGRYPLDRGKLAVLVDKINQAGARALVVDLLLVDRTEEVQDQALADALASLPAVIAAAGTFQGGSPKASAVPEPTSVLWPQSDFAEVARTGLANISTDVSGTPRHMPLVFKTLQGPVPSIGLQAVGLFYGQPATLTKNGVRIANGQAFPLDIGLHLPLRYYGPGGTIGTISANSLLTGNETANALGGRLVLVGGTATGIGDNFATPFDPVMPGVEVLATGIANLMDGSALIRNQEIRWIDFVASMVVTVVGVAAIFVFSLTTGSLVYLTILLFWLFTITIAFGQGYWLSGVLPLAGSLPPVIAVILIRQFFDRQQTNRLIVARSELSRFQAPSLALRIGEDPEFLSVPVSQDAAILFIDLSGFSGFSERVGPAETREILKAFHSIVVDESVQLGGLVLDFMGDGAMIGFGIPEAGPDDAGNAIRTAFALVSTISDWIDLSGLMNDIKGVRVGAHYGPVVLSRLGHETHQQIAATGDCVNVASRFLEIAKTRSASIVASSSLLDAALDSSDPVPEPAELETVAIRGRKKAVQVAIWKADIDWRNA